MERQGRRTLGGGGAAEGIPDSLPLHPSSVFGSHPLSFLQPIVHQGSSSRTGSDLSSREGSSGVSSSSLSRVLQLIVHYNEDLRVVEASHQPSTLNLRVLKMETVQSVLLYVRSGD